MFSLFCLSKSAFCLSFVFLSYLLYLIYSLSGMREGKKRWGQKNSEGMKRVLNLHYFFKHTVNIYKLLK